MVSCILSALYVTHFFVTSAFLFIILLILYPFELLFDRHKKLFHWLTSLWGYHFVLLNPFWKCKFEGLQHIERGQKYVMVANHQSLADIFVLSGLQHNFKWVSKESLLKIPFFGWNMKLNEYVAIERGNKTSIKKMMSACKEWLNQGVSIMMFPEGTRSDDGKMGAFRDGSFKLSHDCNVPMLPIVISGTRNIAAKHSRMFNFGADISIKILPPVWPEAYKGKTGLMKTHVHDLMESTLLNDPQYALIHL